MTGLHFSFLECQKQNTFDQFRINYLNEKFQKLFIEEVLQSEKTWYEMENLDVPFVPFF